MDSKIVNREIRSHIWPKLRTFGFSVFTARTAWRYSEDQIDVFNFQSFNRYDSGILGVTSFSFCVNLGCYLTYLPPTWPPKSKDGRLIPSESECWFRARLAPTLSQTLNRHATANRIWSLDQEGLNLAWCIGDVASQLSLADSWYVRLGKKEEVLRILLEVREESEQQRLDLWGFGTYTSPNRSYLTGYAALSLGEEGLARQKFSEAVHSQCFVNLFNSVDGAINRII